MAPVFVRVDVTEPVAVVATDRDWSKCLFCQQLTNEKLCCPAHNNGEDKVAGYRTLAGLLVQFEAISSVPFDLNLKELAGDDGIYESLVANSASWHKSCHMMCSKSRLERARKRCSKQESLSEDDLQPSPVKTRKSAGSQTLKGESRASVCIFCSKDASDDMGPLLRVATEENNNFISSNAMRLKDRVLFSKCSAACDLMAQDALYHKCCLTMFYNRVRSLETEEKKKQEMGADAVPSLSHGLALGEIIAYIVEQRKVESVKPVFVMADLAKKYEAIMNNMGFEIKCHSSRLKERLLQACPYLEALGTTGKDVLITFKDDVDLTVRSLTVKDKEGIDLYVAAKRLRDSILNHTPCVWKEMSKEAQDGSVPAELQTFVKMVLDGPGFANETYDSEFDQEVSTIAQLLYYHTTKRRKGQKRRHDSRKETPVVVYTSMKLYGSTRKKDLVETASKLGIGIGYDRVQSILTDAANEVCDQAHRDNAVCPSSLKRGIFTTFSVDNIDHNPSSTTATGSFHGTALSVVQHPDSVDQGFERLSNEQSANTGRRKVSQLPENYANVFPCFLNAKNAVCPTTPTATINILQVDPETPFNEEKQWLENCLTSPETCVPWSAHHAQKERQDGLRRPPAYISVLPVWREPAHSMAMMMHAMNIAKTATDILNSGQTVVLGGDQPLFALLKQIQFLQPEVYGDKHFFIMFGAFHIELWGLRTLGDWLESSGWTNLLVEAEITTSGRADSMLHVSHARRSRYAHEVTVAALFRLEREAFQCVVAEHEGSDPIPRFEDWRKSMRSSSPQFKYWDTTLHFELAVLQFVRAIRTANFNLFVEALSRLIPWFFALDHVHYARWLSVHVRDLVCLPNANPALAEAFNAGKFVVNKSGRAFSYMALDQAHEQVNARLKGDGGITGLTEDPDSLLKWMLSAPEVARIVGSFEEKVLYPKSDETSDLGLHHTENASSSHRFRKHVDALVDVFNEKGSPFLEVSPDLFNIETQRVASKEVVDTVMNIEKRGCKQYRDFVEKRLEKGTEGLMDTLKLNKYPLFSSSSSKKQVSKTSAKLADAKEDANTFSALYIASQHRQGDLNEFFKHENHTSPPALAMRGEMRSCKKSDLIPCLLKNANASCTVAPAATAKILDGAALVNMLKPGTARTFAEYSKVFESYITKELRNTLRVDLVWDRYFDDSLKNVTRASRGEGERTRVSLATKVPKGWPNFLRSSENKQELFALLSKEVSNMKVPPGKEVYATLRENVEMNHGLNCTRSSQPCTQPCNHEEADTRLILHVLDAAREGHSNVVIRTVDTDVVVISVTFFGQIDGLVELWISFGTGKSHQYIAIHEVVNTLGPEMSRALSGFHAFTGCDIVESFFGYGKPKAFDAWKVFPEATAAFNALGTSEMNESHYKLLEKFVTVMYDKTTPHEDVNQCRMELFVKKNRAIESIPPTHDALLLHIKRAEYQASVWKQSLVPQQSLLSPTECGWRRESDKWQTVWTSLPTAAQSCREFIKCRCKKCVPATCSCYRVGSCQLRCSCPCFRPVS